MQGRLETRVGIFVLAALGVFVFLGFRIGAFRLDRRNYHSYYLACKDIEGLSQKADIKIAGVKVGWVESITLSNQQQCPVTTQLMIAKEYTLHENAYTIIRQDGLLGPKYIEVIPGDSTHHLLSPGGYLAQASQSLSIDEMMKYMQKIMENVQEVTGSVKELIGSTQSRNQMRSILDSLQVTTQQMATLTSWLNHADNKHHLDSLMSFGTRMHQVAHAIEESIGSITTQTDESLKVVNEVTQKINNGQGCIGKLLNDERVYHDFEYVMSGLHYYFKKFQCLEFVFDSHLEGMFRHAENYTFADSKGYFDIRIYPSEDYFYLFQVAASEKGFAYRKKIDQSYTNDCNHFINTNNLDLPDWARLAFVFNKRQSTFKRNTLLFGFQFGKIFRDIALRFGIFEGTAGAAIDIDIPFRIDNFRWVTSFEIFDFRGWNRKNDRRAHLKWLNRLYIFRQIYTAFGADDFISKHNANFFLGVGVRFGDDDVKYVIHELI